MGKRAGTHGLLGPPTTRHLGPAWSLAASASRGPGLTCWTHAPGGLRGIGSVQDPGERARMLQPGFLASLDSFAVRTPVSPASLPESLTSVSCPPQQAGHLPLR